MTGFYLLDNPNPNANLRGDGQYWGRETRREPVSGGIAVHSTEGIPDYTPPDYGAENTARYFTHSTRPASYHTIVDSDSIVRCLPLDHEAYHDATGGNRYAMGVSFGTQAATWGRNAGHDDAMLRNGARAIAEMLRYWASQGTGRDPLEGARWITPSQYRAREPGLVEHGALDPTRRSDPWTSHHLMAALRERLLSYVHDELGHEEDDMPRYTEWENEDREALAADVADVMDERLTLLIQTLTESQGVSPGSTEGVYNLKTLASDIVTNRNPRA